MKIIIYRNREVYKENSKIGNDSGNKSVTKLELMLKLVVVNYELATEELEEYSEEQKRIYNEIMQTAKSYKEKRIYSQMMR